MMNRSVIRKQNGYKRFRNEEEKLAYALSKALDEPVDESRIDFHNPMTAYRAFEILADSIELVNNTKYPDTFFGRYKDIMFYAKMVLDCDSPRECRQYAEQCYGDYTVKKTEHTNHFIDRCRVDHLHQALKYREEMTVESYEYLLTKLRTLKNRGKRGGKLYAACDRVAVIPVDADEGNSKTK